MDFTNKSVDELKIMFYDKVVEGQVLTNNYTSARNQLDQEVRSIADELGNRSNPAPEVPLDPAPEQVLPEVAPSEEQPQAEVTPVEPVPSEVVPEPSI